MRGLLIFLLLVLLAFAGYGWFWYSKADDFREVVDKSFTQFSEQVTKQNARAKITHNGISLAGFPLAYKVNVQDVTVQFDDITRKLNLQTGTLTVVADNGNFSGFTVLGNRQFSLEALRGDMRETYQIQLNDAPNVMVSLVNKGETLGEAIAPKRFAAVFPKQLVLSFQLNDLRRDIAFDLAMMQLPIWQNMRYDVGPSLSFFYDILLEAAQRSQ